MDRIREVRRTTMAANGLSRRRHRTNSFRDSPEEDGPIELQEPTRLRDRGSGKKDRDRERDRERERDRLGRNKRRRGDRLMHGGREDGGEDTSEESINDEEDEDDEDGGGGGGGGSGSVRMLPLNPSSLSSSSLTNHHRKSFPPAKVFRPAPPTTWKAADEMIGVSVPRKARSASTKRSHECWASSSGGIVAEQNHTSPARAVAAPPSPSSSNASVRKKIKPNGGGPKFRPPKSSSKSSSSAQDEIEIEIAEVLYGMMRQPQSQGPSKQEINDSIKFDSREHNNKSSASDGKSRISSPPQNSSSSATPVSAVAPKRKRPRPVKHDDENPGVRSSPVSSTTKAESDQRSKMETCSSNSDKNNPGSAPENPANSVPVQASPEPIKPESNALPDSNSKPLTEELDKRKDGGLSKEVAAPLSPKKESPVLQAVDAVREDAKATKANQAISESENHREEKFQIDLMAPPPTLRTSPERDVENNLVAEAEKEVKHCMKEDEKSQRMHKEEVVVVETEKVRAKAEENESQKEATVHKERGIDLQVELEKADKVDTNGNGGIVNKKQHQNIQRQHQHQQHPQQTSSEKNVQPNSLPLPMSVPSWPGGLPSMGYMTPLQGVVSMDGTTLPSAAIPQPPHHLFNQPRPKKCATHCYIARNILCNQQIVRMNPFWHAAAGSAPLYGAKPGNLSGVPSTELHGNVPGRAANSTQDKGHSPLAMFSGHIGKDKVSQPPNVDNSSRKQILLQQSLPPGAAPSNILHGPAFIFPMNQQQAAAAASVRPGSVKSLPVPVTSNGAPSSTPNAAPPNTSGTGAAAAPTMSFTYPNMPGNETQYLAILQNNAYPFPIPAHVGAPPTYRGNPAQAFPFFNGSFYSSQMIHPSQIQQQQLPAQSQPSQQGHQNTSVSTGSSSSQKHTQHNQQQKPNNANGSNGGGSLQGFPVTKNPPSQSLQLQQQQQRQQLQNHHTSNPARQVESEMGSEEGDSRLNRATMNMNIYNQNFPMPMQTPNFALMTHAMAGAGAGAGVGAGSNGNHSEKKQQPQHSGPKAGGETSPAFSMPFASINGATAATGLDLSSIAQHHSIMQSSHNYQIMAAASAQLKKGYHAAEEGKNVVNSSNLEEDRKAMSGKIPSTVGQSIAFARPDVSDPSMTSLATNNVIDSSGRNLNLGSASSRATSVVPAAINTNAAGAQQQLQRTQQQILQLQKQNQFAAAAVAAARNKTPPSTSNGSIYSDNIPSTSSMSTKFPNAVSAFPQSLVQSSNTVVVQSSQWKNSARATNTSQSPQTMASTPPSSSVKNPQQQQARSQQAHTQISFAANQKSSTPQVQPANSTQSPSPPVMVGSPTTSSMSKNTGSPRTTTSTSTNNKTSQTSSLSSQQAKNSPTAPTRKSSPVGGRNVSSILSGPQITPSCSTGSKSQLPQQQHQISKQNLQQAQLFFSNPYNMHSQVSQSNSSTATTSAATGYYLQRRGPDQVQRQGSSGNSSNGAAANNSKGSALPTQVLHPAQFAAMQSSGNHHQFVPAGFSYVHPVPTTVQVKPAEQKQPAGE